MNPLSTNDFQETLLRLYLGKYKNRFRSITNMGGIVFCTDPHPMLVLQLWERCPNVLVSLAEYVEVEKEDPYYGAFDYYQIDIITVPVGDPDGASKVEVAIAKSFLAGTKL